MAELWKLESEQTPEEKGPGHAYADEDPSLRFWFPIHFGLYEIIMTCELEVRTRYVLFPFFFPSARRKMFSRRSSS
jgi:hypothetical protein